jgi:predicted DNA-binding antitoxin AbrB/MazE fold protein
MTLKTIAVYSEGTLRPTTPLPLTEGQTVEVTVSLAKHHVDADEEIARRIRAAKSLEEAFAIMEAAPDWDDDYDLCAALNANRHPTERPLFPPELKGISW